MLAGPLNDVGQPPGQLKDLRLGQAPAAGGRTSSGRRADLTA